MVCLPRIALTHATPRSHLGDETVLLRSRSGAYLAASCPELAALGLVLGRPWSWTARSSHSTVRGAAASSGCTLAWV